MQIDAHYYALLTMARSIGIEKKVAHKIAYASQFVDDAKINQISPYPGIGEIIGAETRKAIKGKLIEVLRQIKKDRQVKEFSLIQR